MALLERGKPAPARLPVLPALPSPVADGSSGSIGSGGGAAAAALSEHDQQQRVLRLSLESQKLTVHSVKVHTPPPADVMGGGAQLQLSFVGAASAPITSVLPAQQYRLIAYGGRSAPDRAQIIPVTAPVGHGQTGSKSYEFVEAPVHQQLFAAMAQDIAAGKDMVLFFYLLSLPFAASSELSCNGGIIRC